MPLPTLRKPSPSLAVSVLALVVAASGTSYAAAKITSQDIRNDTIRSVDVQDGTLRTKDFRDGVLRPGPAGPTGPEGPAGPQGERGPGTRWVLVDATGAIVEQSGGFTVAAAYPVLGNTAVPPASDNSLRANGNVYIDAGEDLSDNGIVASIALQNATDQNGDGVTNGRAPGADSNPEFSGEISATMCGIAGVVTCAPSGTNNTHHLVVSPRNSDGTVTSDGKRKRFYVVIS